jgi:hypothetical protein
MNQVLVYLDSNSLIGISDGRRDDLKLCIEKMLDGGEYLFPFSAEQVGEITTAEQSSQNALRLSYLRKISRGKYFSHSTNELEFRNEDPEVVHGTINEVPTPLSPEKLFAEFVSLDQLRSARAALELDPSRLNNLSGQEAVEEINRALSKLASKQGVGPRTINELMEVLVGIVRTAFGDQWVQLGQTEESALRDFQIVTLFMVLDAFGYWPDDLNTFKKGSRFPDSRHVFNASFFNILVSDDKKMRRRAQAVYEVLNIRTKVLSPSEFLELAK